MGKWCLQASLFIFDQVFIHLLVTRTGTKSRKSLNSGRIGSVASELYALQGGLKLPLTYNGENDVLHPNAFSFDPIFIKLAGNED